MKRKVKFQEGGAVEEPARRPAPRSRFSRMSAAARARRAAAQADVERATDLGDVLDFNRRVQRGQVDAETMRRMGATPMPSGRQDFTTDPQGVTRRGTATGRELVPFQEPGAPARPSASRALAQVGTPRQIPLGSPRPRVGGNIATMGGALALEAAEPLANYGRRFMERRGAEADARREANLQAFRDQQQERATMEQDMGEAAQRMPTPRPARPRPAAPAPREISADRLNELAMGAEPTSLQESVAQMRIMERRREMEAASPRAERPAPARAESMGGSGNIGAASARERGEQVGPPGQYNMKKGGKVPAPKAVVKKKAGGMIGKPKAAPKKMMKGGVVAKPKSKAKPMAKPMPFKKGGVIKKGRK